MKKLFFVLAIVMILVASQVGATIRYVSKDDANCGTGNVYCSIQAAFNATTTAGDVIRVRNASTSYNETAYAPARIDGTANNPIIVEPDVGHNPNIINTSGGSWVGAITLYDVSYWTIRNLRFDACSVPNTAMSAIFVRAERTLPLRSTTGIVITGNTINCWGGSNQTGIGTGAITVYGTDFNDNEEGYWTQYTTNLVISNNTITNPLTVGIGVNHTDRALVEGNTITGVRCGMGGPAADGGYRMQLAIGLSTNGKNNIFRRNLVHDFQTEANCYAITNDPKIFGSGYNITGGGIYCDAGNFDNLVEDNEFYNMIANNSGLGDTRLYGVFWESFCTRVTIQRNVIYNIQSDFGGGIDIGAANCTASQDVKVLHNTAYNVSHYGLVVWSFTTRPEIRNNIFVTSQNGDEIHYWEQDGITQCSGPPVINGNQYYSVAGSPTYTWGTIYSGTKFSSWKSACNCDANSNAGVDPHL
jgi:parallel beta helix pectate lyase-like protein